MAMVIDNKFEYGEIVYLKTDPDQSVRMVTGFKVRGDSIWYLLSLGAAAEIECQDIEISHTKDITVSMGLEHNKNQ